MHMCVHRCAHDCSLCTQRPGVFLSCSLYVVWQARTLLTELSPQPGDFKIIQLFEVGQCLLRLSLVSSKPEITPPVTASPVSRLPPATACLL